MLGGDIMETQVDDELSRLVADLGIATQQSAPNIPGLRIHSSFAILLTVPEGR